MKSYELSTPRALFGFAAAALTAATLAAAAVLPAMTGPGTRAQDAALAAQSHPVVAVPAQTTAATQELRYIEPIEVIAVREPRLTSEAAHAVPCTAPTTDQRISGNVVARS